jgi:hypothetical protein
MAVLPPTLMDQHTQPHLTIIVANVHRVIISQLLSQITELFTQYEANNDGLTAMQPIDLSEPRCVQVISGEKKINSTNSATSTNHNLAKTFLAFNLLDPTRPGSRFRRLQSTSSLSES